MNNNDIMLYINSPGGSVSAGLAIYDTMNYIKNDVCTIGIGMCASMGAVILSSGTKGKRYALSNTKIMIHQPLGGAKGKASDIQILANEINKTKLNIINILSKNTKKSKNKIQKDIEKDYYMTSLESKNYNLIDKII
jgi:ATP-dependent Clp protease, protease subunit